MESGDGQKLVGYFSVYNSRSVDLGGFVEVVKPGTFNRNFNADRDIRSIFNHDRNWILGRTKAGTLRHSQNAKGAIAECDLIDTSYARDLAKNVAAGNIDGMSFGFRTLSDNWFVKDGINVRELLDVELLDTSPVTFPAYPATSVTVRSEIQGAGVKELQPLCAALVRLEKKLEIQERDAELITEYRSIIPNRFENIVTEMVTLSRRGTPLDVMRRQVELLEAEMSL